VRWILVLQPYQLLRRSVEGRWFPFGFSTSLRQHAISSSWLTVGFPQRLSLTKSGLAGFGPVSAAGALALIPPAVPPHTLRSGLSRGYPSDSPLLRVVVPLKILLNRRVSPLALQELGQRGRASGSIAAADASLLKCKPGPLILTQNTRMEESESR